MSMKMTIRPEKPTDIESIHYVNEQAFGGKTEAEIVDKLRARKATTISLVAVDEKKIVGHIMFSQVKIEPEDAGFKALGLAPMAVLPQYQRKGVGSRLMGAGLEACSERGYGAVFVVGHPEYYPRFGFVPAKAQGFDCEFEVPNEAWMVRELWEGVLAGRRGRVFFQPEFKEVG